MAEPMQAEKGGEGRQVADVDQGAHCPTCRMSWDSYPPVKCDGSNHYRCINCKAVYSGEMLAAGDLKAFAERVLIYQVEGREQYIVLKFDGCECEFEADSPDGVALLKIEAARRAAISKATGGV